MTEHKAASNNDAMQWDPNPLPPSPDLEPVAKFDPDSMLPECLRPWIKTIAAAKNTPMDYVGVSAIAAFGALIGPKFGIRPENDDFTVVNNNYTLIIGRPSQMKSAAMDTALDPLFKISAQIDVEAQTDRIAWDKEQITLKLENESINQQIKTLKKKYKDEQNAGEQKIIQSNIDKLIDKICSPPARFEQKMLVIQDTTGPALKYHAHDNPDGLIIHRDEFRDFLKLFKDDRSLLLDAHSGKRTNYLLTRAGTGSISIPRLCVSIFAGIQPGPMAKFIHDALNNGSEDDGLIQRYQFMVQPDQVKTEVITPPYNSAEFEHIYKLYKDVHNFDFELFDLEPRLYQNIKTTVFTKKAQKKYFKWKAELIKTYTAEKNAAIESHLTKYKSLLPSLALIFHIIEVAAGNAEPGPVPESAVDMAWLWCDYLESHVRRIYDTGTVKKNNNAIALLTALEQGRIKIDENGFINKRNLARQNIKDIKTTPEIMNALYQLRDTGHLTWLEQTTPGGHKQLIITVNPIYRNREARKKQYLKTL